MYPTMKTFLDLENGSVFLVFFGLLRILGGSDGNPGEICYNVCEVSNMITMDDIIREGHPTLEKRAKEVGLPLDEDTKKTLTRMRQFLINSQDETIREEHGLREGVGLSAPQIGISKRMLAIYTLDEDFEEHHDYIIINPKIIGHSVAKTYIAGSEGCLSVDREVDGVVPRHKRVSMRGHFYRPDTDTVEEKTIRLRGFLSVVIQHEIDHLDGILFTKRIVADLERAEPIEFKLPETEDDESTPEENHNRFPKEEKT